MKKYIISFLYNYLPCFKVLYPKLSIVGFNVADCMTFCCISTAIWLQELETLQNVMQSAIFCYFFIIFSNTNQLCFICPVITKEENCLNQSIIFPNNLCFSVIFIIFLFDFVTQQIQNWLIKIELTISKLIRFHCSNIGSFCYWNFVCCMLVCIIFSLKTFKLWALKCF